MIVECYTADVYCECEDHEYGEPGHASTPDTYTGPNKRSTDRQRRACGWVKIKGQDVCPDCKTRKPCRVKGVD